MNILVLISLILLIGINFSYLMFNEEMIMCVSLMIFFTFLFRALKSKTNILCYTDIKAMYIYFIYVFIINIKSVSMFLYMYNELARVVKISYISEYMINALAGVNSLYKITIFKYRFITALFSSYWIMRLYILRSLILIKLSLYSFLSELSGAVAYDIALINNYENKYLC